MNRDFRFIELIEYCTARNCDSRNFLCNWCWQKIKNYILCCTVAKIACVGLALPLISVLLHLVLTFTQFFSAETVPDEMTLMNVSEEVPSFDDCEKLAVYLQVRAGSGIVLSLRECSPTSVPEAIAFKVLKQWKKEFGSQATSAKLGRVLVEKLDLPEAAQKVGIELDELEMGDEVVRKMHNISAVYCFMVCIVAKEKRTENNKKD